MNKNRSTQILEVLLLPYTIKEQKGKQVIASFFRSYSGLLGEDSIGIAQNAKRRRLMDEFRRAKNRLIDYLTEKSTHKPVNLDDLYMLFELYFPKDDILQIREEQIEDKLHSFYFYNLERIADSLLTFRDGTVAIRTWKNEKSERYGEDIFGLSKAFDKVEIWNNLSRMITTDTLTALFTVMCGLDLTALYGQSAMISLSDKLLGKILQKGVAETHLHLNASYDFQTVWEKNMDLKLWRRILERRKHLSEAYLNLLFTEAVIRICLILFLNEKNGKQKDSGFYQYVSCCLPEYMKAFFVQALSEEVKITRNLDEHEQMLSLFLTDDTVCGQEDYLFQGIYREYRELHTGSELIFLYQCFAYLRQRDDSVFRKFFLRYIRLKNAFYNKCAQRNGVQGLDLFQRFFASAKKAVIADDDAGALIRAGLQKHLNMAFLKKLEVRTAPVYGSRDGYSIEYKKVRPDLKQAVLKQAGQILSVYRMLMLERLLSVREAEIIADRECREGTYISVQELKKKYDVSFKEFQFPTIGIIFHFLKRDSVDDIAGFFCWRGIEDDLVKYSNHRLVLRHKLANLAKAIEDLRSEIPYLHEYIVGIDAASNENASEPWILSPAFNSIRTRNHVKPVLHTRDFQYQKIANIGFTYHVGEDFRHPLSGLRHTDEVIDRFFCKSGDRLGHAIVLGMDMARWVKENEAVGLKAREEMEDYLWLWGKMMYSGWDAPIQVNVLEGRILGLAQEIYDITKQQSINNMNVDMLYKAYNLKFAVNHEDILKECLSQELNGKSGNFCQYSQDACPVSGYSFWNEKKLLCTQYCPVFERRCERVRLVSVSETDIPLLQYIQNKLIQKIEQIGIFIETNPTSNLTIGEIQQMSSHPIFKLNSLTDSPGSHHAMVTINADDPCVFHTDVENETAYIYHALEHDGYQKEEILNWIDKVRDYGMKSSFVSGIKDAETMFSEITEILTAIRYQVY